MTRAAFLALALIGILGSSPVRAAPLAFGEIDQAADLSQSADVAGCSAASDGKICRLTRESFGGLAIDTSSVSLNPAGRVRSLSIALDDRDYETARQLLTGRYGPPTTAAPPRWTRFDDRATISLHRSRTNTRVDFTFPANDLAPAAKANPELPFSVLIFVLLGLGVGAVILRVRRAQRSTILPMSEPSMRQTLERRLRTGRDLQF